MTETPETIYLIPGEDVDGAPCMAVAALAERAGGE